MAYDPHDLIGFPPPSPPTRTIDFASVVQDIDSRVEVPVTYSFGGPAPTMVSIGEGRPFEMSDANHGARMFVEFQPYVWSDGE